MGKGKTCCRLCEKRHFPPTGKKCPVQLGAKDDQKSAEVVSGSRKVGALWRLL